MRMRIYQASYTLQNLRLPSWYKQITDYTDVNKTSIATNKTVKQRLRMLHSPAVNHCM